MFLSSQMIASNIKEIVIIQLDNNTKYQRNIIQTDDNTNVITQPENNPE
jgi:small nuclear ribonucleoprotein (snRNP)-like protein